MNNNFIKSIVLSHTKLNYKTHLIRFQSKSPLFKFKPGQYIVMKISDLVYRDYSIASLPTLLPFWEIVVDTSPNGPGSRKIKSLKAGDIIETSIPIGNFIVRNYLPEMFVFGVTGCGLAPIKPMIEYVLNLKKSQPIMLFWGLRFQKDLFYQQLLDFWAKNHPNFEYCLCFSKPNVSWQGCSGHITSYLVQYLSQKNKLRTSVYLCGSNEMITDLENSLKEIHFPLKRLHYEKFF